MAKRTIPYVKSKFETGDRPTGADYADLIDTLAGQATDMGLVTNNEVTDTTDHTVFGIENLTTIDSFSVTDWRMVKYMVSISNTTSGVNKVHSTELTVLIDNDNINVSQYGMIDNNGDIGTIDVSKSNGIVSLRVIPRSALTPVTARFYRTGLKA
jgi:hypothetical protein